jgi:hypothetical protein
VKREWPFADNALGKRVARRSDADPTPPGNGDGYQNKGIMRKAIRKNMKTKGEEIGSPQRHGATESLEDPPSGIAAEEARQEAGG